MARRIALASAALVFAYGCQLLSGLNGFSPTTVGSGGGANSASGSGGNGTSAVVSSSSVKASSSAAGGGGSPGDLGSPCKTISDCASGNCVDGVCCDLPCAGPCESCKLSITPGTCGAVPNATDPKKLCLDQQRCEAGKCTYAAASWAVTFGTDVADRANAVAIDATGVYFGGDTFGKLNFGEGNLLTGIDSYQDAFVVKRDTGDGTKKWSRSFYGPKKQSVADIAVAPSGIVVVGTYDSNIHLGDALTLLGGPDGKDRGYVTTLNPSDGTVLAKAPIISTETSSVNAVAANSGGIVIAGTYTGKISAAGSDYLATNGAGYVAGLDDGLKYKWFVSLGEGDGEVNPRALAVNANGDIVVTGELNATVKINGTTYPAPTLGYYDAFVLRLDKDGKAYSLKLLSSIYNDYGTAVVFDGPGIALGGFANSKIDLGDGDVVQNAQSVFVVDYDSGGALKWKQPYSSVYSSTYDNSSVVKGLARDPNQQLLAAGAFYQALELAPSFKFSTAGSYAPFVAKYAANGALAWGRAFVPSSGSASILDVALTPAGDAAIVVGWFDGTLPLGGAIMQSKGYDDIFVTRVTTFVPK